MSQDWFQVATDGNGLNCFDSGDLSKQLQVPPVAKELVVNAGREYNQEKRLLAALEFDLQAVNGLASVCFFGRQLTSPVSSELCLFGSHI